MSLIHAERTPLFIKLSVHGQVDSSNATEFEQEIKEAIKDVSKESIVIDMEDLDYISSAGLRVLLRVRKAHDDLKIINVSPEVYEIFDMTGFTQMMDIQKAYRVVSVEGCEVIGTGANGTIYRIDQDNVVNVY
ncbi:MAG: STAS domain-containing protein, partial [Erysipelotrichaceae bacterium]|nr:STAS domain-containing protein [Erysipelotrichaceae bacterium]